MALLALVHFDQFDVSAAPFRYKITKSGKHFRKGSFRDIAHTRFLAFVTISITRLTK